MSIRNRQSAIASFCVFVVATLLSSGALAQVITVTPTDLDGWVSLNQAGSASVAISDTNPTGAGTGSVEYLGMDSSDDRAEAGRLLLMPFNSIGSIGYDYYTDNDTVAAALKLEYYSLARFGTLNCEPSNNGGPTVNAWTTVDGTACMWWSTEFGQVDLRSWADWQTELGSINVTFIRIGAGSGWVEPVSTFMDNVVVGEGSELPRTWDFETTGGSIELPPYLGQPVPTMSTWAIIALMLAAGFIGFRRLNA